MESQRSYGNLTRIERALGKDIFIVYLHETWYDTHVIVKKVWINLQNVLRMFHQIEGNLLYYYMLVMTTVLCRIVYYYWKRLF